jgi:hypothetical protein
VYYGFNIGLLYNNGVYNVMFSVNVMIFSKCFSIDKIKEKLCISTS